jgi:quinol monooxygenase YgiN
MATFIAHVRVLPGRELEFERVAAQVYRATHELEPGMQRYEFWRAADDRSYYIHASFDDFLAFIDHQISDHHESAGLKNFIESIRLEWVDPVPGAADLCATEPQSLPAGASALASRYGDLFGIAVPVWWMSLRQSLSSNE